MNLCVTGIYKCDPVLEWLPSYRRSEPYHCCNWMFRPYRNDYGEYYMCDTYWRDSSSGLTIRLTPENIGRFEFVCDMDEIVKVSRNDFYDYDESDRFYLALDSGGWSYSDYYYVKKDANKNKELVLELLLIKLNTAKNEVEYLERRIKEVEDDNLY